MFLYAAFLFLGVPTLLFAFYNLVDYTQRDNACVQIFQYMKSQRLKYRLQNIGAQHKVLFLSSTPFKGESLVRFRAEMFNYTVLRTLEASSLNPLVFTEMRRQGSHTQKQLRQKMFAANPELAFIILDTREDENVGDLEADFYFKTWKGNYLALFERERKGDPNLDSKLKELKRLQASGVRLG